MEKNNIYTICPDESIPDPSRESSRENKNSSEDVRRFGYYSFAPYELFNIAEEIISEYHPHLKDIKIAYLFRSGKWKSKGEPIMGRALVAAPMWRCASGFDLILVINEMMYKNLDRKGKKALLDHQLSHFSVQETGSLVFGEKTWAIRGHDVQEFSDVVKRHGICFSNLRSLMSGQQLQLESLQDLQRENSDELNPIEEEEVNLFYEELG
ncbi:MAG TPA: hypothetical protein GX401_09175 [Clostridiales bacterium]|nr:hypothetical protein [Clostridiales bacterium]